MSLVVLLLGILTMATLSQSFFMSEKVECLEDKAQTWTQPLNAFFARNSAIKHGVMILCSLMMDVMVLVNLFRFALQGATFRFPLALLAFYIFRGVLQSLFLMRYPAGYLWDFPGVYSITVPYGRTNDFFFSGHIGCCMINYCEYQAHGWGKFAKFSLLTLACQSLLMLAVRGHYVIDLVAGVVFAHYIWMMTERYSYLVDVKVFNIPFRKRFPLYTSSCAHCQHPVNSWVDPKNENMPLKH